MYIHLCAYDINVQYIHTYVYVGLTMCEFEYVQNKTYIRFNYPAATMKTFAAICCNTIPVLRAVRTKILNKQVPNQPGER